MGERVALRKSRLNLCIIPPYSIVKKMTHTIREKEKLVLRVRRIRGQIEAVERALTTEQECSDVLQLITAARGAMNSLMAELVEDHVRFHVLDPNKKPSSEQALAADELVDIIRSYLK
jgi:DNA-binding FrmR family transcriptional regulator